MYLAPVALLRLRTFDTLASKSLPVDKLGVSEVVPIRVLTMRSPLSKPALPGPPILALQQGQGTGQPEGNCRAGEGGRF